MARRPTQAGLPPRVKRRAELTFKGNLDNGRHGWLRLTPAYSVRVVDDILQGKPTGVQVLDPFSGTGTTVLCAAMRGLPAVGLDINPFLVWLGNAKSRRYRRNSISEAAECAQQATAAARGESAPLAETPPIANVSRWWDPEPLAFLRGLKGSIDECCPAEGPVRDLLSVAFCRTIITLSNAAFNHQSMSFKRPAGAARQLTLFDDDSRDALAEQFGADIDFVLAGARQNPRVASSVLCADSRQMPSVFDGSADLLITSPPYPNRMSYIRELRPYMYWLGFLKEARDAGELDWQAIGGTWGVATSRVASWEKDSDTYFPAFLEPLMHQIRRTNAKSGEVLARYVGKYFEDIWLHLMSALRTLRRGAEMHYIVGNSKFYDVLVPVEVVYKDMLDRLGVARTEIIALRKRSSKKELVEYDVVAIV